jgi:hypothetical protein
LEKSSINQAIFFFFTPQDLLEVAKAIYQELVCFSGVIVIFKKFKRFICFKLIFL